ncbi:uncharacterized protein LOC113358495 [Papaver somniferum]|uniref:uncharacterized protein LOC113358495 n=1 Tax=Papaver somniferum TaxID=3469 RepID=UPI000E703DD2|nr:uncharacterized protein LOC113358495 [Papaver somniferum]
MPIVTRSRQCPSRNLIGCTTGVKYSCLEFSVSSSHGDTTMPRTRLSSDDVSSSSGGLSNALRGAPSTSPCPSLLVPLSQFPPTVSHSGKVPCPFKDFDGCGGGVRGGGYAKSAIYKHLTDKHFPSVEAKDVCRERIQTNVACFGAWESTLACMQIWLCIKCLQIHSWKKKTCMDKSHPADIVAGPLKGNNGAYFLIHGTSKPATYTVEPDVCNHDNHAIELTVEMYHLAFLKRVTTIVSIPPQCRLQFSRVLKAALDKSTKKQKKKDPNLEACRRKLGCGHFSAAIRILSSDGIAPAILDTLDDL